MFMTKICLKYVSRNQMRKRLKLQQNALSNLASRVYGRSTNRVVENFIVQINKTASIGRFHKTETHRELFFNNSNKLKLKMKYYINVNSTNKNSTLRSQHNNHFPLVIPNSHYIKFISCS